MLTRVSFQSLGGFPRLFLDYLQEKPSLRKVYPCTPTQDSLKSHASEVRNHSWNRSALADAIEAHTIEFGSGNRLLENVRRFREPDTLIVVTGSTPELFGGRLSTLYKCLSISKVASWLDSVGIPAIPVYLIHPFVPSLAAAGTVHLVTPAEGIRRFQLEAFQSISSAFDPLIPPEVENLTHSLPGGDAKTIADLAESHRPGVRLSRSYGRYLSRLTEAFGIIFLDASELELSKLKHQILDSNYLYQLMLFCDTFPTAALVTEAFETAKVLESIREFSESLRSTPLLLPQVSATLLDRRAWRILDKYGLGLERLFAGSEGLMVDIGLDRKTQQVAHQLDQLKSEVQEKLDELGRIIPREDQALEVTIGTARTKMIYQVEKLREKFAAGGGLRKQAVRRHLDRVCTLLAPQGQLQERWLGSLQFLLSHTQAVVPRLYEAMDPWKLEHQLILIE